MYGASTRLTRKPGQLFTTSGNLLMAVTESPPPMAMDTTSVDESGAGAARGLVDQEPFEDLPSLAESDGE